MKFCVVKQIVLIIAAICLFGIKSSAQPAAGSAIMAVDERAIGASGIGATTRGKAVNPANPPVSAPANRTAGSKQTTTKNTSRKKTTVNTKNPTRQTAPKTPTPKKFDGFTIGNEDTFFNFEIVKAVQPIHTIKAQDAGAKGLVQVEILIDVDGRVLQARARSGNKLLHPEAEKAALMTEFRQFSVYGKPARAFGFIVFRFGKREE